MKRIAWAAFVLSALVFGLSFASAESMPELFQKVRQQVKLASYAPALETIAALDAESSKPGNESDRAAMEPSLRFYRGVCEAGLGREKEAEADFAVFLAKNPRANIDPAIYPKRIVAVFEKARRASGSPAAADASNPKDAPSLKDAYARFKPDPLTPPREEGSEWAAGPVQYLLTADEKRDWDLISDAGARSEFLVRFWAARDPRPETSQNEFREEFERRVLFADGAFRQGELRGSLTDRGMVFVLVGPPFNVGRRPITGDEDGSDVRRPSATNALDVVGNLKDTKDLDTSRNQMETWHYRRESLPKAAPYKEVVFHFITRKGYGENVMQREPVSLTTLDFARRSRPAP